MKIDFSYGEISKFLELAYKDPVLSISLASMAVIAFALFIVFKSVVK